MENHEDLKIVVEESPDVLPNLIRYIAANEVADFDSIEKLNELYSQYQPSVSIQSFGPPAQGARENAVKFQKDHPPSQRPPHSISISMPPSPIESHLKKNKRVLLDSDVGITFNNELANSSSTSIDASSKKVKFHSQPIPAGAKLVEAVAEGKFPNLPNLPPRSQRIHKLKDKRYNSFKTWSGKLERQLSHLRGKPRQPELPEANAPKNVEVETLSADRYFDALEGPELDTLRPSEEILLPEDKQWPFLLRYPISSFGICLGVSSQAIMWKTLASSISTKFLHISPNVNLVLWCISLLLFATVATTYLLKVIFYFEAVRREYYHPIRVNFFFAPWIALLFLAIGVPQAVAENLHASLWYILMAPIFVLELKIYGQWMSGGQRRLSKVANPSNHLSVVGNFVGALLGASMGLKEGPIFFFAIGLAHYTVLFVTLYQRLPTNETLPKELHPVFFLFVAAPSVASMAWANIQGSFDNGARVAYFIALFLYFSLAVRVNFFRGFRFSLAWWAYTFPMTGASIATIKYANEVQSVVTKALSIFLCSAATLTVTALLLTTILHAFVLKDLFPNDIAIAISDRKPKPRKWYHRRNASYDNIENYLKFVDSDATTTTETTKESTPEPPVLKFQSHCVQMPS